MAEKIQTLRVTETTAEQLESDFKDELIKVSSQYYVAGMTWQWQIGVISCLLDEGIE